MSVRWMVRWRQGRHAVAEPAVRRRGRRLTIAGVVLAISAAVVPAAVWAGTPGTDPANGQWVGGKVISPGPELLVLWKLPGTNGVYGTCINAYRAGPLRGPYTRTRVLKDPVYGELNHLYANPTTSDVQLAELSALNSRAYDVVNRDTQWSYVVNKAAGLSVADAGAMLQRAKQLAGPYTVTIALPDAVRSGAVSTATATVRSASNIVVPRAKVAFTASNVTLQAATATTDSSGRARVSFTVPHGATTKYTLRASVQSWTDVAEYSAPGEQTMLTAAPPSTQTATKIGAIVRDRSVSLVKAAIGDPRHTAVAGYVFRISDANGKVVIPSVVSATTPVSLGPLTMGAKYVATEVGRPANATLYIPVRNTLEFTVPDGSSVWTLLAEDPVAPSPTLATQVTSARAAVGESLTDVVTVAGNDGEAGTIDAVLYGPVPSPSGRCAALTLAAYQAARATHVAATLLGTANRGNGRVLITSPPLTAPGCYGWAETLTLRPSGATASSPPTAPNESTLVTSPPHHAPPRMPTSPPHQPATHKPATQPAVPQPRHTPPPTVARTPALAETGALVPVVPTLLAGLGLIGAGALLIAAARRGRRA